MGDQILICESLISFPNSGLLTADPIHISHYLLNERVCIQLFGVNDFAVYDAMLGKGFTNGNRVNIVQTVIFCLGVKSVLLDELCDTPLYLCPGHFIINVRSGNGDMQRFRYPSTVFSGEPRRRVPFTGMVCHITDNCLLTFNTAVPALESFINLCLCDFTGDKRCFNCCG